jgi:hypothetical protein
MNQIGTTFGPTIIANSKHVVSVDCTTLQITFSCDGIDKTPKELGSYILIVVNDGQVI